MPGGEFCGFSILFDAKSNPLKGSLSKFHFLCRISSSSSSIPSKNGALTIKIDHKPSQRSWAPGTNPLKTSKGTTFGTFLQPSIPPLAIFGIPNFRDKYALVHSRYISCSLSNLRIGQLPGGGGPENVTNFGDLSTLTLILTQPRRQLETLLRPTMTN